jgi:NADP-dependent aldehyde dehydrogenase
MTPSLTGTSFIGFSRGTGTSIAGRAIVAATGDSIAPDYFAATPEEVETALHLAGRAFPEFSALPGTVRANFLRRIAEEIEAITEAIVVRGGLETALPEARLRGETGRTLAQLRLFASLIEEGSWVDARIEHAQPDRQPLPKPDLRSMLRPLGPVAVFCPSNFPLAYSVAGGDTASALAVGCPVVVTAHHSHPGVAELVGHAVTRAAQACGMPEGVFSLLYGGGRSVGQAVVRHPVIQAVGFTGSRAGGTALLATANARPQPIPVYAEMSSINPVVILEGALQRGGKALATAYFNSLTLGVGQFCTNPGLVFLAGETTAEFLATLAELVAAGAPGTMLNSTICQAYADATAALAKQPGVRTLARGSTPCAHGQGAPAVFLTTMAEFLANPALHGEMFGPAALIVTGTPQEVEAAIPRLEGQLTATLHATDAELAAHASLLAALERRAGRLICNGFPTGVEVCHSMVHGGPFPATTDGRSTSVGSLAIFRFTRLVAFQNFPDAALPVELQHANPLGIRRLVDGVWVSP